MIREDAYELTKEFIEKAQMKKGQLLVVGCSTSEVFGSRIGTDSKPEIADDLFQGIYQAVKEAGIYLAAQCCEHLNRAIIVERQAVPFSDIVNVVPQPKAGGSFGTTAYKKFNDPVAIEEIKADAEKLAGYVNSGKKPSPKFSSEIPPNDSQKTALLSMLRKLNNNN